MAWLTLVLALGATAGAAADAPDTPDRQMPASATAKPASEPKTVAPPAPAAPPPAAVPQAAAKAAPKPRPRLSTDIKEELAGQLPAWVRPPPEPPQAPPPPPPPDAAGADVVKMKPVVVLSNREPRVDQKEWLTPKARDEVLKKEYLSEFDRSFLNRYTLPIIGVSQEARARQMYEEDQRLRDLKYMNDQVDILKKTDPQAAQELQKITEQIFTRTDQGP